jgi:hypothetical protein
MGFKKLFTSTRKTADRGDKAIVSAAGTAAAGTNNSSTRKDSASPVSVLAESKNLASRLVRYSEDVTVHEIPSLDELSDQEFDDIWLRREELLRIRKRERKLLKKQFFEGDVGPDDDAFGLESKEHRESKHLLIESSIKSVLGEQGRQLQKKMYDPERIAWVYSRTSVESGSLAHERGLTNHYQLLEVNRPHRRRWSMDNMRKFQEPVGPRGRRRTSMAM